MNKFSFLVAASLGLMAAGSANAATNLIAANVSNVTSTGTLGVLRSGSGWAPAPAPASLNSLVDNVLQPENQIWYSNSVWWDEDASVNTTKPYIFIALNNPVTFDSFLVQADDNDSYLVEYWDGAGWQSAWNIDPLWDYGLMARSSGLLAPITTDLLRFSANAGDGTYSVSEIQGFMSAAVPEPASWAMMIAGIGLAGGFLRRDRRQKMNVSFA